MKRFRAKTLDGRSIIGEFVDAGVVDSVDANGTPYKVNRSIYRFDNKEVVAELSVMLDEDARWREDMAYLVEAGLDDFTFEALDE